MVKLPKAGFKEPRGGGNESGRVTLKKKQRNIHGLIWGGKGGEGRQMPVSTHSGGGRERVESAEEMGHTLSQRVQIRKKRGKEVCVGGSSSISESWEKDLGPIPKGKRRANSVNTIEKDHKKKRGAA